MLIRFLTKNKFLDFFVQMEEGLFGRNQDFKKRMLALVPYVRALTWISTHLDIDKMTPD